jgi:hypothetical protein
MIKPFYLVFTILNHLHHDIVEHYGPTVNDMFHSETITRGNTHMSIAQIYIDVKKYNQSENSRFYR